MRHHPDTLAKKNQNTRKNDNNVSQNLTHATRLVHPRGATRSSKTQGKCVHFSKASANSPCRRKNFD